MSDDEEPSKILLPYIHRAKELDKYKPRISYYCKLYALTRGLEIPPRKRTKTTNDILESLMNQLDEDENPSKWSSEDKLYVAHFAMNVFMKADKQDRSGRANLNTAKTFYAASLFIEILHGFGELQSDLEQKQKYAAWRAAEIRKALYRQRKHIPGSTSRNERESNHEEPEHGIHTEGTSEDVQVKKSLAKRAEQSSSEDSESEVWEDACSSLFDIDAVSTSDQSDIEVDGEDTYSKNDVDPVSASHLLSVEIHQSTDCAVAVPTTPDSHVCMVNSYDWLDNSDSSGNENDVIEENPKANNLIGPQDLIFRPSAAKIAEAHRVSKLAVSALAFDDVPSALLFLEQALHLLTAP